MRVMKQIMGREIVVAITEAKLDLGHSLIKHGHELPDDVVRKDGDGNVAVSPGRAPSGDRAD